jgi:hypothetical protein
MAVKRTKRQKQQTSLRREEILSYSINDIDLKSDKENFKKKNISKIKKVKKLVVFDTSYVLKDLTKTLVVTLLVVGVLIAYTIYGQ